MTATCVSVSNNISPVLQTPCRPERLDMLTNVTTGSSAPLGTTPSLGGVNFSVYSSHATGVELLLFDHVDDASAARVIRIDPIANRTYHYWHVFVPGLSPGQIYGYRVDGPWDPARGMRFDPTKILLDPYGRGVVVPSRSRRTTASEAGGNCAAAMKSVVVDINTYDWEGDTPLRHPSARTIIYEMHARGFTRHPSSGVGGLATLAPQGDGIVGRIPHRAAMSLSLSRRLT